jgi:hypothetical protein
MECCDFRFEREIFPLSGVGVIVTSVFVISFDTEHSDVVDLEHKFGSEPEVTTFHRLVCHTVIVVFYLKTTETKP